MSGFEYAFVSDVPREYFCPICNCVMREPVQTKCGHRFCKHCLEKSMKRKRKCPIDRRALDERSAKDIYPDVAFERTILDFFVKCPNERYGCKWSGELRSVQTHEISDCNFVGVKCTNKGCEEKFLKKDLNNHVNNICPKRNVECHHCKTLFLWCFRQKHFDACKKYPMDCLQGCRQKIARDKMNDHIEESCPYTKLQCTFAVVGCQVKVQRKAIQDHLKGNTESHLKLVCDRLQELEAGSTSTLANMEEMQTEISAAMQKIEELWEAVLKNKGLEDLRDKIAATNKKLEKLQSAGEAATGAVSSLQSEVVAIKKDVEELSTKVTMELQGAINQLQKSIPKIDILHGLREEVAGINKKLRTLQQAITGLQKRDSHAKSTVCACNNQGALDEIEHVEHELRREFQTQLRYLRERAERDKKEMLDRLLAERQIVRKIIVFGFLKMFILLLLCIRYRNIIDPFLDIVVLFFLS